MTKTYFLLTADVLPPHDDPWPTAGAQFQPYPAPAAEYVPAHFDRVDHPLSEVKPVAAPPKCPNSSIEADHVNFLFSMPVLSGELRRPCAKDRSTFSPHGAAHFLPTRGHCGFPETGKGFAFQCIEL